MKIFAGWIAGLALTLCAAGCASQRASDDCAGWRAIYPETDATVDWLAAHDAALVDQIAAHNAHGEGRGGWRAPRP